MDWTVAAALNFLRSQVFITPPKPTKDFTGETVVVTGSNTGLGFEAVRHISRLNASLIIMAVRSLKKGEAAKKDILESTGRPDSTIEVWELDLQSFDSIRSFVVKANHLHRIDVLIENAGIMTPDFKLVEGYESTMTVNVIGTFLLALLILPKLKESASRFNVQPRLSVVTSDLHAMIRFPEGNSIDMFDTLNSETNATGEERYAKSKLVELLVVRELGSILSKANSKSPEVIINCVTPGACKSDFNREAKGLAKFAFSMMMLFLGRSTEVGGRTLVTAASAGEESNGEYLYDSHIEKPAAWILTPEGQKVQRNVWTQLVKRLELTEPGISVGL